MKGSRLILLTIILGAAGVRPAAARDALYGVISRGTTAVAVGDSGRVLFSPQAPHVAWFGANPVLVFPLRAVTTGASDYVAVGDRGAIIRSTDGNGTAWLPRSSRTSLDLFGVSHSGDRVVAVGDSGVIDISASLSADNWTILTDRPTRKPLRAVVGGSRYAVAVGDSGAVIWAIASATSAWYAATVVPSTNDLLGVAEGPGASPRFWAVGKGGTILRSYPNAQTWEALESGVTVDLNGVTFFGTIGIAVGDGGTVLYSNGGQTWSQVESPTAVDLYAVAYTGSGAGGGFVAVGDENIVLWSALGETWEIKPVPVRRTTWGSVRGSWGPGRPGR